MKNDNLRLIEDYLPIEAISAESLDEKGIRRGHISTLHLWWARRPLVACRAAIYAALVDSDHETAECGSIESTRTLAESRNDSNGIGKLGQRLNSNRVNAAAFVTALCKYDIDRKSLLDAESNLLTAHASRLTRELNKQITAEDIRRGDAPRPKVLDVFAGGGSIPLEALRLGCEAYAVDLNPVAHIIELCTLAYPHLYGASASNSPGCGRDHTWAGLAVEVEHWGNWVLRYAAEHIADRYASPQLEGQSGKSDTKQTRMWKEKTVQTKAAIGAVPVYYLWTRTVRCKNASCGATVPLLRQTVLCKKKSHFVALRMITPKGKKQVRFEVASANSEKELGFDPRAFSKSGNAVCPFCGTVADSEYVKSEGCSRRLSRQLIAIACSRKGRQGKIYLAADEYPQLVPDDSSILEQLEKLCKSERVSIPEELIVTDAKNSCWTHLYGLTRFGDLFTPRQLLSLLTFVVGIRKSGEAMRQAGYTKDHVKAVSTYLACVLDKQADFNSSLAVLVSEGGRGISHTFGRQALPMVWDFPEANPFNGKIACWESCLKEVVINLRDMPRERSANVVRASATQLPWEDATFDALVTDPPYYDNVPYANISDFFYVWLKRSIGHLYPEHFSGDGTPKKPEAVADASRHNGDRQVATASYEKMMADSFKEARRVLKPDAPLIVVYAHKTTLGWSTLVDALRRSGFVVTEAWPLDTERRGRLRAQNSAALASSIFLVARRRDTVGVASYEEQIQPELAEVVRERVETLWGLGITGADFVIASVGAGLRAFTRYERVEYANGEEMPAEKFLAEVEAVVLDALMAKVFGSSGSSSVAGVDSDSRFYVLWRYVYKAADIDAGEAIVFTYGQHVELDGSDGLSSGKQAFLEKKKGNYRLRDFTERGDDADLGVPDDAGNSASLINILHRTLWLMENQPRKLREFIDEARPNREQLRVVAAALAGPGLSGKSEEDAQRLLATTPAEQAALGKLLANWKSLVPESLFDAGRK